MNPFRIRWAFGAIAATMISLAGTTGFAGFTVSLDRVTPIASGPNAGDFLWTYSASIAPTDTITPTGPISPASTGNHFFEIYDFKGYVAGTATAPSGWSVSTPNSSSPPPPANILLLHGDDPTIPNLVFKYTSGSPIVGVTLPAGTVPGTFTAVSAYSSPGNVKDFVGQLSRASDGSIVASGGDILAPVPEPIAMISTGLGLLLLGVGYALKSRKPAIA